MPRDRRHRRQAAHATDDCAARGIRRRTPRGRGAVAGVGAVRAREHSGDVRMLDGGRHILNWSMTDDPHAPKKTEDDPVAWSSKNRTEIEFGFYVAALPFVGLSVWQASNGSFSFWIAAPAIVLVALGLLAGWVTKPDKEPARPAEPPAP